MPEEVSPLLAWQRKQVEKNRTSAPLDYLPWKDCFFSGSLETKALGEDLLKKGKVGCLILAGGQGSRLGKSVPKGTLGVSVIREKSLFQLFFERILYSELLYGKAIPVAIMTSFANHEATVSFLKEKKYFGLSPDQVFFFKQEDLPFLSCEPVGEEIHFLEESGQIAKGPSGNGDALRLFYESGLYAIFQGRGVEHLSVIPVDNALANPVDVEFLGFHIKRQVEVSVKSIIRNTEQEKVGLLVSENSQPRVVEYSEKQADLSFKFANIGIYCFSFTFILHLQEKKVDLPWHYIRRKVHGHFCWKFERFLFDVFLYAKKIDVFVEPREICFSPLKNEIGEDSFSTVKKDLLALDRKIYKELLGQSPPVEIFELSLAFHYLESARQTLMKKRDWVEGEYVDYVGC